MIDLSHLRNEARAGINANLLNDIDRLLLGWASSRRFLIELVFFRVFDKCGIESIASVDASKVGICTLLLLGDSAHERIDFD